MLYQTTPTVVRLNDTDLEAALDAVRLDWLTMLVVVIAVFVIAALLMTLVVWVDRKAVAGAMRAEWEKLMEATTPSWTKDE